MQLSQNNIKIGLAIAAGIAAFAVIVAAFVWVKSASQDKSNAVNSEISSENDADADKAAEEAGIIEEQLRELDSIRQNQDVAQPLTEQEVEEQLEQLEDIRQTTNPNPEPLTQEEIENQLKQLDEIRNSSK